MNRLWAPWRHSYVTSDGAPDRCVLCDIGADPDKDGENFVLHREKGLYVVLNRFPYINGHLMIVPLGHLPDISSLGQDGRETMMRLIVRCERVLLKGMNCMGMNGGWNLGSCAGAGITGHVHMHILPRWSGDVNFMSTVGGTRVMSASLEDTYERLAPLFREEGTSE